MYIFFLLPAALMYNVCIVDEEKDVPKCGNIPIVYYTNFSQIEYPKFKEERFSIYFPYTYRHLNIPLNKKDHDQRKIILCGVGSIHLMFENGLNMTELAIEKDINVYIDENKNVANFDNLIIKGKIYINKKDIFEPFRVVKTLALSGNSLMNISRLTSDLFQPTLYIEYNSMTSLTITSNEIMPIVMTNLSYKPINSSKYEKVIFKSTMTRPLRLSFNNIHGLNIDSFPSFTIDGKVRPIYFDQTWDQPIKCNTKGYFESNYLEPIMIYVDSDHDIVSNLVEFNSVTNFTLNGCKGKYALGLDHDPPDQKLMTIPYKEHEPIKYNFKPYKNALSLLFLTYSKNKGSAILDSFDPSLSYISIFGNSQHELNLYIDQSNITSIDVSSMTVNLQSNSSNLTLNTVNIYGNGIMKFNVKHSKKIYLENMLVYYGQIITVYENKLFVNVLDIDSQFSMGSMDVFAYIGKISIADDTMAPKNIIIEPNCIVVKHSDDRVEDLVIRSDIAENNNIYLEIISKLLKYSTIKISWKGKEGEKINNIPNICFNQDESPIILFDNSWSLNPPSSECKFPCNIDCKTELYVKKEFEDSLIPSLFNLSKSCTILKDTRGWYCAISSLQDAQYCMPQDTFVEVKYGYHDYPFESDENMECTIRIVCKEIGLRGSIFNGVDLELISVDAGTYAEVNMIWDKDYGPTDIMLYNVKLAILSSEKSCDIVIRNFNASMGSQIYPYLDINKIKLYVTDTLNAGLFLIGDLIRNQILQPISEETNQMFMRINYDYRSVESISNIAFSKDGLILNDYLGSEWKIDYDYYGKLEIAINGQSTGNSFITIDNCCPSYTEIPKAFDFAVLESSCTVTFTERWLTIQLTYSSDFIPGVIYSLKPNGVQIRSEYPGMPGIFTPGLKAKVDIRYDDLYYLTPNDNDYYSSAKVIKISNQQLLTKEDFPSAIHDKLYIMMNGTSNNLQPILSSDLSGYSLFIRKAYNNQPTQYITLQPTLGSSILCLSGINSSLGAKSDFSSILLRNSFISGSGISTLLLEANYTYFMSPYFATFKNIYNLHLFDPRVYDFSMEIPNVQHISLIYTSNSSKTYQCMFNLTKGIVFQPITVEQRAMSPLYIYFRSEWISAAEQIVKSPILLRKGFDLTVISHPHFNFSKFFIGKAKHSFIHHNTYFCFYNTQEMKENCPYSHEIYQYTRDAPIPASLFKDIDILYGINIVIADSQSGLGPTFAPSSFFNKTVHFSSNRPQKIWIDSSGTFPKSIFLENINLYFEKERFVVPHFKILSLSKYSSINAFSMSISVEHLIAFPESMPSILDQTKETKISLMLPNTFSRMICSNEYTIYYGPDEPMRIVYNTYKEMNLYAPSIDVTIDIQNPHHTPTHEAILYNVPNIQVTGKASVTFTEAWQTEKAKTDKKAKIFARNLAVHSSWGGYPANVFNCEHPVFYLKIPGHYCIYNKKPSISTCPNQATPVYYSPERPIEASSFDKSQPSYWFYIADTIQGGVIFDGKCLKKNTTFIGFRAQNITINVNDNWPTPKLILRRVNVQLKGRNVTELSQLDMTSSLISGTFLNISNSIAIGGTLSDISACWSNILKDRQDVNLRISSFHIVDIGDTKVTIMDVGSVQRYIIPRKSVRRLTFTSYKSISKLFVKSSANKTIAFIPNFVLNNSNIFLDDSLYNIYATNRSRGTITTIGNVTVSSNGCDLPSAYVIEGNYIANFTGVTPSPSIPEKVQESNVLRNVAIACVFIAITLVCAVVVVKRTFMRMDYNESGLEISESSALQSLSIAGI